ncbi:unnamed protein product [Pelagomonas calceolata]|uniref:Secreted protein n=1 Tax=Pelagomonas calceolata TaxID=35677 RepID=A0A8J2SQ00_9STRA|nr:unnamed protein product [Pelagomonas calceolata]
MRALAVLAFAAACPRAAALVVYYNVFSKNVATAVEIVYEQLTELRAAPIWDDVEEIRYSTIGKGKMRNHVERICREVNATTCRRLGSHKTGHEERTLTPLHAFCTKNPEASVAYLHDKGSFRNVFNRSVRGRQKRLRQALLRGLGSVGCLAAITKGDACDVCSTHFTALPHQHTKGNMWLASCRYVATLLAPPSFQKGMDAYWGRLGFDKGGTLLGTPWVGTGRYAMEHWVHSHPSVRPCDVSEKPLETLEDMIQLASGGWDSSVATAAPRVDATHPGAGEALGERIRGPIPKNKRNFSTIVGEWQTLYGEVPPESSLLLRKYRQMYGVPAR